MRKQITRLLAVASIAAAVASTAGAQPVIDDFETGTFHLVAHADQYASGVASVISPSHAMAAFRQVQLFSFEGVGLPAYADLNAWTIVDDRLRLTFGPDGGSANFIYEPLSPVDLTASGLNDRVEVAFSASTVGGTVLLEIWDGLGGFDFHTLATSGGVHAFPFTEFAGVNLTHVTKLRVMVKNLDWSAYDVRDIRAMRSDAIPVKFDIPVETVTGPPYPTPPLIFTVTDNMPSDRVGIRLLNATKIATGGAAGLALTGTDSGEDMEAGFAGDVTAAWNESGRAYEGTAFDLRVDVEALSGVSPEPFLPAMPVITPTPTGFLLQFDVHVQSGPGQPLRTSKRQMPFDTFPGQGLQLANVRVVPSSPFGPQGPIMSFRVTFDLVATGDVDPGEPLFALNVTGDCRLAATSGAPVSENTIGSQTLRAWPIVTRAGVDFVLARPADAAGRIDLFDASGRLLRRLEVPRGVSSLAWDGRDSGGRSAAGVYFARFTDGTEDLRARIVRIR